MSLEEELKEGAEHAHQSGEKGIGLTMALVAVLLAIATLMGHRTHTEEGLIQGKIVDEWNFYQAKHIRAHEYGAIAEMAALLPNGKDLALKDYKKSLAEECGTPPEHGCFETSSHASTTAAKIAAVRLAEMPSRLTVFQSRKSSASHSLSSRYTSPFGHALYVEPLRNRRSSVASRARTDGFDFRLGTAANAMCAASACEMATRASPRVRRAARGSRRSRGRRSTAPSPCHTGRSSGRSSSRISRRNSSCRHRPETRLCAISRHSRVYYRVLQERTNPVQST